MVVLLASLAPSRPSGAAGSAPSGLGDAGDVVEAPDDVEIGTSDGILRLDLRDGTKIVINSHRAAGQIWMAAIATASARPPRPTR